MDRPHILYNDATKKFVMWVKLAGTEADKNDWSCQFMGVAQADSVTGPFQLIRSFHPLGMDSGDFDLVKDPHTGKAYIYFERVHTEMICADLTDDYLDVTGRFSEHFAYGAPFTPEVEERLLAAEIDLVALFETERGGYSFRPFSKYPSAERDLAVVVDASVPAGDMLNAVRRAKINDLTSADIFDVYRGSQVGEGKKSVALTFGFASPERTLTDDEIAAAMKKILSLLRREFGAKIRQ